jgi:diaminopimelate decarboxylase
VGRTSPDCPGAARQFRRRAGTLSCEEVSLDALAERYGTPLYVYSKGAIVERIGALRSAFGPEARICYAVKSNGNLAILRLCAELGASFDIVSVGELERLRAAGVPTAGAVFAGVGKEEFEIERALDAGILMFNVESLHELELIERAGARRGVRVPLAVRLNPDVDAGTHAYISTARKENKFGVDFATARTVVRRIARSPSLSLRGYHVHLGSQVRRVEPYLAAFDRVAKFLDEAAVHREGVEFYDLGGGFGIDYGDGGPALDVAELARQLLPHLAARGLVPVLEPGRFVCAEAGVLVTRVIGTKAGSSKRFVVVDAAMNDLLRPALYGASHPIVPVAEPAAGVLDRTVDVVGPVCESGDFLARDRLLPELADGALLAVSAAGAYGASMASNYNSRRRPAEVLVDGGDVRLIRRRESFADLWAQELEP